MINIRVKYRNLIEMFVYQQETRFGWILDPHKITRLWYNEALNCQINISASATKTREIDSYLDLSDVLLSIWKKITKCWVEINKEMEARSSTTNQRQIW